MIGKILKKVLPKTVGFAIVLIVVLSGIDYLEGTPLFGGETVMITGVVFVIATLHDVAREWRRIKNEELKNDEPKEEDMLKEEEDE